MGLRATIVVETHLGKLCVCPKLCIRSVLSAAVGSLFSLANSNGVAHRTGFRICCSLAGLARLCLLRASVPCLGNFKCRDLIADRDCIADMTHRRDMIADRDCIADNKYLWYFFGCLSHLHRAVSIVRTWRWPRLPRLKRCRGAPCQKAGRRRNAKRQSSNGGVWVCLFPHAPQCPLDATRGWWWVGV